MEPRARLIAFGSAGVLVVASGICALLVSGLAGEVVALSLLALGLGGLVLLVFLEVGLSEDRDRAKEEERRRPPPARRP
jgi:hypothetical protein